MELVQLQRHIRVLAGVPETAAPVISCYVNLESGRRSSQDQLQDRVKVLRATLSPSEREPFESAWAQIEEYLGNKVPLGARSVALFARGGTIAFFFPLVFRVPLPTMVSIDSTPNIYHLVELKDTYERYVIFIWTNAGAQIVEVNVGSATKELWVNRPELRAKVGQEWSQMRYQSHHRKENSALIREAVSILDEQMHAGGHSYLILAGAPEMTERVRKELPDRLLAKLVDTVSTGAGAALPEVVSQTLFSFIRFEEKQSLSFAKKLLSEIRTGGPAVVGARETLQALRSGQADVLIMAQSYHPDPGWACGQCGRADVDMRPAACPDCESKNLRDLDVREELVRLAERRTCLVEIVKGGLRFGGVGALLRYRPPNEVEEAIPAPSAVTPIRSGNRHPLSNGGVATGT